MQNQYNRITKKNTSGIQASSILVLGLIAIALIFSFAALFPKKASIAILLALLIVFFIGSIFENID